MKSIEDISGNGKSAWEKKQGAEKGSPTSEMIAIFVFWAAHRLAALACQRAA
jgi:hypothetical protein